MKSSHFDILLSMSLKGISTKRRKKERWAVQYKNEKRLQSSNNLRIPQMTAFCTVNR